MAKKTMAKKITKTEKLADEPSARGSKSDAIRAALHVGISKPLEIVDYCKRNGVTVTTGLVAQVKAAAKKKRGRKSSSSVKKTTDESSGGKIANKKKKTKQDSHGMLDSAAEFIRHSGGVEAAQSLLGKIKQLFGGK